MKQMTKDQAITLFNSDKWKNWTDEQIVALQLFQDKLCISWTRFHQAIESALGRSVYSHEFGSKGGLRDEYLKKKKAPTLTEIIDQLPKEKLIIIKK